ncbi:MAG: septum formation inhibitor Maf [Clostridiales bacterium]|nr:septum formation inhibitor Maf [Clostridiales bacterium]
MDKIILASQSPRRRELLTQIGLEFTVCPSTVEESITSTDPVEAVKELSLQKAEDVAELTGKVWKEQKTAEKQQEECLVIGADTIVVYEGRMLGKPKDREDAIRMLTMLQGRTHSVYTGVTLIFSGKTDRTITFAEETKVSMYPMSEEEIFWYVDTKEPMDKAGAYGIQGLCARFIEKIEGDYNNVVGLPVARIYQELKKAGGIF